MNLKRRGKSGLTAFILLAVLSVACGPSATSTLAPVATEEPETQEAERNTARAPISAPGIVDPSNLGWPRLVSTKGTAAVEIKS